MMMAKRTHSMDDWELEAEALTATEAVRGNRKGNKGSNDGYELLGSNSRDKSGDAANHGDGDNDGYDAKENGGDEEDDDDNGNDDEEEEDDEEDGIDWGGDDNCGGNGSAAVPTRANDDDSVVLLNAEMAAAASDVAAQAKGNRNNISTKEAKLLAKEERERGKRRQAHRKRRRDAAHRMDLLSHLARAMKLSSECDDCDIVWAKAKKVVPAPFVRMDCRKRLGLFVNWFSKEFKVCDAGKQAAESSFKSDSSAVRLARVLKEKRGSQLQLLQVFVAMCRSVAIPCRLCAILQPRPFKTPANAKCSIVYNSAAKATDTDTKSAPRNATKTAMPFRLPPLVFWAEVLVSGEEAPMVKQNARWQSNAYDPIVLSDIDNEPTPKPPTSQPVTEFDPPTGEWMFVNPLSPGLPTRPKLGPECPYVVALGAGNHCVDVTAKYVARWTKTSKARHDESTGWWHLDILERLREGALHWLQADPSVHKALSAAERARLVNSMSMRLVVKEEDIMAACRSAELMPTSLEGFRCHPRFVLASHITKFRVAVPGAKTVGSFKGKHVYLREDIKEVKSELQWKKLARVVNDEDKTYPVKLIDKIKKVKRPTMTFQQGVEELEFKVEEDMEREEIAAAEAAEQVYAEQLAAQWKDTDGDNKAVAQDKMKAAKKVDKMMDERSATDSPQQTNGNGVPAGKIALFGKWQTRVYEPPTVGEDGKIPTTEFGNVEMWTPAHCPKGGVHVNVPLVAAAAAVLGIPYAPALIGFEYRDRRQVPILQGIVVATMFAGIVEEAAGNLVEERARKQQEKKRGIILARWEKMVRGMLVRNRLKRKYGTVGSDDDNDGPNDYSYDGDGDKRASATVPYGASCDHKFKATGKKTKEGTMLKCTHCGLRKIVKTL